MKSSPSAGPPESKPKRGLARLTFKTRSKNNQTSAAPQFMRTSSIHRKSSLARKDSRRQSRLAVRSKRVSFAQNAGSRISGRSHSPSTQAAGATKVVNPPVKLAPLRGNGKSGGGLLRRLTRHFTSNETPAPPPPPVPVPTRLAAKFPPPETRPAPVVPAIVQPPQSNPQSRARSRSPTPAGQRPRSISPAPSTASKNSKVRSPSAPSPDRVSLASWRYPPLSPSPVPPSPSLASPVPPFSPSLSPPVQAFSPGSPSRGLASDYSPAFPGQTLSPTPASPAPGSEPPVPAPSLEPPEVQESVDHESSNVKASADSLASLQELEVPEATFPPLPPTPSLVHSDTESSAGHQYVHPFTPTLAGDEDDSQLSRGRRPRHTPLLTVPGRDSDAPPSLMEDDGDAWTDDEGVFTKSKEHLPQVEEAAEIPRICSSPERKPLTVIVPPSGGLTVTVDLVDSPTEMATETPSILEPVDEGDEDEFPSNHRWSQAPKTGGIEFILPAEPHDDAPLKTSQSDKPRGHTLDPHSLDPNAGGSLRPGAMRRSTTFSRIFNFGSKRDLPSLSTAPAASERRPSADRIARRMSIIRGPSRLELEANRLPTRAPTVYAMTNAELADQFDNLRTKRVTLSPGTHTPTVVDDETARMTELAYF